MPNSNGKLTAPLGIASVVQCTGNPMLDVGFQCMDSKPYFKYVNGSSVVYTTIYPTRNAAAITAGTLFVYGVPTTETLGYSTKARTYYIEPSYLGTASAATTSTITYNGTVYTWDTANPYLIVRMHLINKWAKYKPIIPDTDTKEDITDTIREGKSYGLMIKTQTLSEINSLIINNNYGWDYLCPQIDDWKRLGDFIKDTSVGYNHNSICPIIFDSYNKTSKIYYDGHYYYSFISAVSPLNMSFILGLTEDTLPDNNMTIDDVKSSLVGSESLNVAGYGLIVNGTVQPYITTTDNVTSPKYPLYYTNNGTKYLYSSAQYHNTIQAPISYGYNVITSFISLRDEKYFTVPCPPVYIYLEAPAPIFTWTYALSCVSPNTTGTLRLTIVITRNNSSQYSGEAITDVTPISETVETTEYLTYIKVVKSDGTKVSDISGGIGEYSGETNPTTTWNWSGAASTSTTTTSITDTNSKTFLLDIVGFKYDIWNSEGLRVASNVQSVELSFSMKVTSTASGTSHTDRRTFTFSKQDFIDAGFMDL